jgi:ribosomal protein S27AE
MTLNESQRKFISDRINTVWKGKRECPICNPTTVWGIGTIVEVREFNEGDHCPGAAITPLIQVQCNNCGYTVLLNAIALGVVDRDTGKVKESP